MASKDYYKVLNIKRDATDKDIKTAYHKLAKEYHPDVNKNAGAEERFKEVSEAYQVLSDKEKRRKYDTFGSEWDKPGYSYGGNSGSGYNYDTAKDSNIGDIFDSIFGGPGKTRTTPGGNTRTTTGGYGSGSTNTGRSSSDFGFGRAASGPRPVRGDDREQQIDLTLEEAYSGTLRQLQIQNSELCNICGGSGLQAGRRCTTCNGLGVVPRNKRLEVRIPAGVDEESKVRVPGEGGSGLAGGPRGDLYLKVHITSNPQYERHGADLHTTLPISVYNLILGGEAVVPSLKGGKLILKVPPETPNGKIFRLSGRGMPILNRPGQMGDMYVKVDAVMPNNLSSQERDLFQRLRDLRPE